MDLLKVIIASGKAKVAMDSGAAPQQSHTEARQTDVDAYSAEGYQSMTTDGPRNEAFELAIKQAVRDRLLVWLEIGPGSDAVLTKMVFKASRDQNKRVRLVAFEGNVESAERAREVVRKERPRVDCQVFTGLSTNPRLVETATIHCPDVLLHEILGFFAGSEGAVSAIKDIHRSLQSVGKSPKSIPCAAATFFRPINPSLEDLKNRGVHINPGVFALLHRLPILNTRCFEHEGVWDPPTGMIELIDFENGLHPSRLKQVNVTVMRPSAPAIVRGLGTWMWCMTSMNGAPRRWSNPGFPYGSKVTNALGELPSDHIAFSTLHGDDGHVATNWPNVFLPFSEPASVSVEEALVVSTIADLSQIMPRYEINVALRSQSSSRTVYDAVIDDFYPIFN